MSIAGEGREKLPLFYHIGDTIPLTSTAVGRVLLSHASSHVISHSLEHVADEWPLSDSTPPNAAVIQKSLESIRTENICILAFSHGGIGSTAVPIRDGSGSVIATLGMVYDLSTAPKDLFAPLIRMTGAAISRRLAGPQPHRIQPDWGEPVLQESCPQSKK